MTCEPRYTGSTGPRCFVHDRPYEDCLVERLTEKVRELAQAETLRDEAVALLRDFHEGRSGSFVDTPEPTEYEEKVGEFLARIDNLCPECGHELPHDESDVCEEDMGEYIDGTRIICACKGPAGKQA